MLPADGVLASSSGRVWVQADSGTDALESRLQKMKLMASNDATNRAIGTVSATLADVLPSGAVGEVLADTDSGVEEAMMWECFATVFADEVSLQCQRLGRDLDMELKRQILADILVWAEVTQDTYDKSTAAFITDAHQGDLSFQRIGRLLSKAKADMALLPLVSTAVTMAGPALTC